MPLRFYASDTNIYSEHLFMLLKLSNTSSYIMKSTATQQQDNKGSARGTGRPEDSRQQF